MRTNGIAYSNLRAEMGRKGISIGEMAEAMSFNRDTLSRKLSRKSPITLEEAFSIQQRLFPELDVNYLFEVDAEGV